MTTQLVGVLFAFQIGFAIPALMGVVWVIIVCVRTGQYGQLAACLFVPLYIYYWLFCVVTEDDCQDVEALQWVALPNLMANFLAVLVLALGGPP